MASKSYSTITSDLTKALGTLRKEIPETMQGFSALHNGSMKAGVLSELDKELLALAIGVSCRCDGCIGFHTEALVKLGASRSEVEETLGMAIYMGGGPALMYAADAIGAFDQFQQANAAPIP